MANAKMQDQLFRLREQRKAETDFAKDPSKFDAKSGSGYYYMHGMDLMGEAEAVQMATRAKTKVNELLANPDALRSTDVNKFIEDSIAQEMQGVDDPIVAKYLNQEAQKMRQSYVPALSQAQMEAENKYRRDTSHFVFSERADTPDNTRSYLQTDFNRMVSRLGKDAAVEIAAGVITNKIAEAQTAEEAAAWLAMYGTQIPGTKGPDGKAKGLLHNAVSANYAKAKKLLSKGASEDEILDATGFKVVDNELMYAVRPEEFSELTRGAELTSQHLDEIAANSAKVANQFGEPLKFVSHFDADKQIRTVNDLAAAPVIKTEIKVKGKVMRFKSPVEPIRADSARGADDKSPTVNGLVMLTMSSLIPRLGGKASEMAADHLYKSIKMEAVASVEVVIQKQMPEWYKEVGRKKPSLLRPALKAEERRAFGEDIARAIDGGGTGQHSKAAKAVADAMFNKQVEMVGRAKQLVKEMEANGVVFKDDNPLKLLSEIEPDPKHLSRLVSKSKMDKLEQEIGRAGVIKLIRQAFKNANTGVPEGKLDEVAASIYATYARINDNVGVFVKKEQAAELERKLRELQLGDDEIRTILDTMGIREAGRKPGMLNKRRMELDMTTTLTFKVDGKDVQYSIVDLFERDANALYGRWVNTAAGLEAMGTAGAKHGLNLTDDAEWNALIAKGKSEGADETNVRNLNAYRDLMMGYKRDPEVFGVASSLERTARTFTTYTMSANFLLAQAGDIGGLGTRSMANVIKGIKSANEVQRMIKSGEMSKDELRHALAWSNMCLDNVSASTANSLDTAADVSANVAERAMHWSSKATGMSMVSAGIRASEYFRISHFASEYVLKGADAVDTNMFKHLARFGLDQPTLDALAPMMRKHAMFDKETQAFVGFDKNGWMAEDIVGARTFEMAIQKAGNTANATASGYGETAAWARSTMAGRFIMQLQQAVSIITQRTQGDIYNFDAYVLNGWVTSLAFSAVSYMARVGLRYYGDEEELEKRLSMDQIFLASVRNGSFAGVWPNVLDGILHYSGLMPGGLHAGVTNSGRNGGAQLPIQSALQSLSSVTQSITGLGKEYDSFTQQEALTMQRMLLPIWYVTPLAVLATQGLDKKNPKRPPEESSGGAFN